MPLGRFSHPYVHPLEALVEYPAGLTCSEICSLENLWRQHILDVLDARRDDLVQALERGTPLSADLWQCILSMNETRPSIISEVRLTRSTPASVWAAVRP